MLYKLLAVLSYVWFQIRTFSWTTFVDNAEMHYDINKFTPTVALLGNIKPPAPASELMDLSLQRISQSKIDLYGDSADGDTFPADIPETVAKNTSKTKPSLKKPTKIKATKKKAPNVPNRKSS